MKPVQVIINEQHSLMQEQEQILIDRFGHDWELFKVPSQGWTLKEMNEIAITLSKMDYVVFASPVPYLLMLLSKADGASCDQNTGLVVFPAPIVKIFHNDNREKRELPNGKIIMTVAQTGWQLV